mgnify:CR=1 FL=1
MNNRQVDQIMKQTEVESQAIQFYLETFPKVEEVIQRFDGKVINKRFYDAVVEAAGVFTGKAENFKGNPVIRFRYNNTVENLNGIHIYAQWFRDCDFQLTMQEDGKRLDAAATLEDLKRFLAQLKEKLSAYESSELQISTRFKAIQELQEQMREIKESINNPVLRDAISEQIRRSY